MADYMILGEGVSCGMDPEETGVSDNIVVMGTAGRGKTMSIVEPRLLEKAVTDPVKDYWRRHRAWTALANISDFSMIKGG